MKELTSDRLPDGTLFLPDMDPVAGVLVIAGSSGRVDNSRARLFAEAGCAAATLRYFGGSGQAPGICEIPLKTFVLALDVLVEHAPSRLGIVGTSKGAEAALAVAVRDARVNVVVGFAPTSVTWGNLGAGHDGNLRPQRSSWTWQGKPLPFVNYDDDWPVPPEPIAYRPMYEHSLRVDPVQAERAALRVEDSPARLVLVAGDDDQLWPSDLFARQLAERRQGRDVDIIIGRGAGHHARLPGEPAVEPSSEMARGGNPSADAALGERAWPQILEVLHF
ncbi:MAG TPA: acyl-CoA thioester hydrolase/BAAT C-terminal domain-containing protein [Acidimicrobiales bacterium]|nr:acyl-CoA thioester hydrolase/BAAT C-terminal domain-containing protein [Acidimicrobiales bacterium]